MPHAETATQTCSSQAADAAQPEKPKPYVQLALFDSHAPNTDSQNDTESGAGSAHKNGEPYEESNADPPVHHPPLPWDDSHWNVR